MSEYVLRKENDRLFIETAERSADDPKKSEGPMTFKWAKAFERLNMELRDIELSEGWWMDNPKWHDDSLRAGARRSITARGSSGYDTEGPNDVRIFNLIDAEGGDFKRFDSVEVILEWCEVPELANKDKEKQNLKLLNGILNYEDGESLNWGHRSEPYLSLILNIPAPQFDELWHRLAKGGYNRVILAAIVDVFQSEVERSLAEPYMPQDFYIERDHISHAYFSGLAITNGPLLAEAPSAGDDLRDIFDLSEEPKSSPVEQLTSDAEVFMLGMSQVGVSLARTAKFGVFLLAIGVAAVVYAVLT